MPIHCIEERENDVKKQESQQTLNPPPTLAQSRIWGEDKGLTAASEDLSIVERGVRAAMEWNELIEGRQNDLTAMKTYLASWQLTYELARRLLAGRQPLPLVPRVQPALVLYGEWLRRLQRVDLK